MSKKQTILGGLLFCLLFLYNCTQPYKLPPPAFPEMLKTPEAPSFTARQAEVAKIYELGLEQRIVSQQGRPPSLKRSTIGYLPFEVFQSNPANVLEHFKRKPQTEGVKSLDKNIPLLPPYDDLASYFRVTFPFLLLERKVSHLLNLTEPRNITVTYQEGLKTNAERSYQGSFTDVARLGYVPQVDYILSGEFISINETVHQLPTRYFIRDEDYEAYQNNYAAFQEQIEALQDRFSEERQEFLLKYTNEKRAAESKEREADKEAGFFTTLTTPRYCLFPTFMQSFYEDSKEFKEYDAKAAQFQLDLEKVKNSVLTAETYKKQAIDKKDFTPLTLYHVSLSVKLIDAHSGEIVWAAYIRKSDPELRSGFEAVMNQLISNLFEK